MNRFRRMGGLRGLGMRPRRLKRYLALLAPALLAACAQMPAPEAEPLAEPARFEAGVPVELVRYAAANGTAYDSLPPGFPALDLPSGARVLGSMAWSGRQRVVFAVDGNVEEAVEATREALLADDWLALPMPAFERSQVFVHGDVAAEGMRAPQLCHQKLGTLSLLADEARAVVTLDLITRRSICGVQMEHLDADRGGDLVALLPALRLPQGEAGSISGTGGPGERKASVRLTDTRLSLRRLANHFSRQMEEQGWRRDAQWRGGMGAGSSWVREAEEGRLALAFLEIRPIGEGFDIDFRLRLICDPGLVAQDFNGQCAITGDMLLSPPTSIRGLPVD